MQIQASKRWYFTPIWMAKILKTETAKGLLRVSSSWNPVCLPLVSPYTFVLFFLFLISPAVSSPSFWEGLLFLFLTCSYGYFQTYISRFLFFSLSKISLNSFIKTPDSTMIYIASDEKTLDVQHQISVPNSKPIYLLPTKLTVPQNITLNLHF